MRPAAPKISIAISVEAGDWPPQAAVRELAERAISAVLAVRPQTLEQPVRNSAAEISILLNDDSGIRKLNNKFRGKDQATNVLSFSQKLAGGLLGDVILASETVRGEAALAGKTLEDHMAHLIIHGFLHLLGYDHEEDEQAEIMEALERAALKRMGIADPYAAA